MWQEQVGEVRIWRRRAWRAAGGDGMEKRGNTADSSRAWDCPHGRGCRAAECRRALHARITTSRGVQQANARATWQPWLRISKNVAVAVGTAPPAELAPPGGQAPAPSARVPQTRTGTPLMPPPRRRLLPTSASPSPRPAPMRRWNAASSRLADLMTLRSATHLWRVTTTCRCRAVGPPHCASGERSCPRASAASCRKRRSKLLPPPRCTTTTRGHIGRKRRHWRTGFPKCVMALPGTCVRTFS